MYACEGIKNRIRNKELKQHLFEIQILCNIINVFNVTFDQINVP